MADTALTGYVALAKQSAQGTPNTVDLPTSGVLATSATLGGSSEASDPDPEIGGSRNPDISGAAFGGFALSGDIEGYLRYAILLPRLLQAAGFVAAAPVETGASSGVFQHTFTPGAMSYLTVESRWGLTDAIRRFRDVLVNELTIEVNPNERATLSASCVGMRETWQASPTAVTYPAVDPVGHGATSAIALGGLGTYRFASATVGIANNLSDDEFVIGSRFLGDLTPGAQEITVGGEIRLGNNTPSLTELYRAALYGAPDATEPAGLEPFSTDAALTIASPKLIGASTTEKYRAVFTMPHLVIAGFPLEASGADPLGATIEGRAYDGPDGPSLTVDIYNARSTAY